MLQAVSDHQQAQRRLILATLTLVKAAWRRVDEKHLAESWQATAPVIQRIVSNAQQGAATNSTVYVPKVLAEQGINVEPEAEVVPESFAGWSSDGRPLRSLLDFAPQHAERAGMDEGQRFLDIVAQTLAEDAERQAQEVSVATRGGVGYVRIADVPCCQRCAVLAGRVYRWNEGFERHPQDQCTMAPTSDVDPYDPGVVIGPDDVKDLTINQRKAIADGADMDQVINAHRQGARSKDKMTTTSGITRRAQAGKRLIEESGIGGKKGRYFIPKRARLTPEGIYTLAGEDRDLALRLLRKHGYIR